MTHGERRMKNESHKTKNEVRSTKCANSYKEFYMTGIAILLLASCFMLRPYIVSGGSMEPTLSAGDVVIVEKLSHRFDKLTAGRFGISRGDILVHRNPHQKEVIEVKRVVGMPGELVELGEDGVTVTDSEGRITKYEAGSTIGGTNNGAFRIQLSPEDYFVLGDNRSKSSDGRDFGAVQKADIIGTLLITL